MTISKIFLTGCSGFIGTNLIEYFVQNKYDVINIDIKTPKIKKHFKYWNKVNLLNYELLKKIIEKYQPDFVLHLAARTDLNSNRIEDYNSNTTGTQNIIQILNQTSSVKRVIFCSSMLVCKPGYIPKHETDFAPSTIYGKSKVMMENIIRHSSHNYEWAIVRPTSIWGPWFSEPYRNFFDLVINKRYFHIGNRSCAKTYGYVENIIYQIDAILNAPSKKVQEKVFYLADYEPMNIHVWADEIAEEQGISIKSIPYLIVKVAALGGDVLKYFGISFPMTSFRLKNMTTNNLVDLSNTKEIAQNLPFSRIEGIRKTLNWLITQRKGNS